MCIITWNNFVYALILVVAGNPTVYLKLKTVNFLAKSAQNINLNINIVGAGAPTVDLKPKNSFF